MGKFRTWAELNEATPVFQKPNYVPDKRSFFGNVARKAMDAYYGLTGREIDWNAADQQNQAAKQKWKIGNQLDQQSSQIDLQKQQQQVGNHPDDPNVRQSKSQELQKHLKQAAIKFMPGSTGATIGEMADGIRGLADSLTMGRPIQVNDVEDMMRAAHRDNGIDGRYKEYYWRDHIRVLNRIIVPTFEANPQTWYKPNATTSNDRYPPGVEIDSEGLAAAAQQWRKSPDRAASSVTVDVMKELTKFPGVTSNQYTMDQLLDFVRYITDQAKKNGAQVKFDPADYQTIHSLARQDAPAPPPTP